MTKPKKPFVITGPGVYMTNGKYLVEIIGRAWRLFTTPPNDKKSFEPWIGVKQDQFRTIVQYQGNGELVGGDDFINKGKLVKRMIEHDTPREKQEAESRAAEEKEQKYLMNESGLRSNIFRSLEDHLADFEVRAVDTRKLLKLPFGEWKKSGYGEIDQIHRVQNILRMVLNDLDDTYDFILNPEDVYDDPVDVGEHMTLTRRPGKKGGLPKMANMEDLVIYVADRLNIRLKGKQWIEPTINLPGKAVKAVEVQTIQGGKVVAKLKKPVKIPTVKMEAGAFYKDGKGKIHGPMLKIPGSVLVNPKFNWEGKVRNANGVSCSKLGSGKYFNTHGRALDEGKDGINHLIERVTINGDKYEKPEVRDYYFD